MNIANLIHLIQEIVNKSKELKDKHTNEINAQVNYCCIFSQSEKHFDELMLLANKLGTIVVETKSGPIYKIKPIDTVSGVLHILKIRKCDKEHPELGDADFTITDYLSFKEKYLPVKNFLLIEREYMEMIELREEGRDVRVYFSFPTILEIYNI